MRVGWRSGNSGSDKSRQLLKQDSGTLKHTEADRIEFREHTVKDFVDLVRLIFMLVAKKPSMQFLYPSDELL